ncbi:transglycosylase SLT domain-containing protein [Amycolatopsis alkalitolerans]|uniref:Lytic transglycosylase n=1 Tax=Amycolatopsis alkalitolerans TaxID=2547244 RepID=A0A5C4LZS1_9PSEU|nr:transglycosylase SLT domain-containing protein [Amycolatopsis alkalitolerans]TNC23607.1 lytic transglycosylase [Amycolatopsis alkalitolerans]
MSTLSAEQIAQHAYKAGFRGHALTTAVAVAMAESGGNAHAHNGTPPDNSYGLWQVNMLGSLGPARREQFHLDSNKELFNADENAKAAYAISSHGKSFEPWSTYTNGAYKKHLAAAKKAAEDVAKHHGKATHHKGSSHDKGHHKGNGHDGYRVDPGQFHTYTKKAGHVAGELRSVGSRTVHAVTGIAKDSFGKVGEETGFADALGDFSRSLERQVAATGKTAQGLGSQISQAAKTYQGHEEDTGLELKKFDAKGVLG